jgi:hypothetical protein
METITSKSRRDKMTNKAQQDEEEERGNIRDKMINANFLC